MTTVHSSVAASSHASATSAAASDKTTAAKEKSKSQAEVKPGSTDEKIALIAQLTKKLKQLEANGAPKSEITKIKEEISDLQIDLTEGKVADLQSKIDQLTKKLKQLEASGASKSEIAKVNEEIFDLVSQLTYMTNDLKNLSLNQPTEGKSKEEIAKEKAKIADLLKQTNKIMKDLRKTQAAAAANGDSDEVNFLDSLGNYIGRTFAAAFFAIMEFYNAIQDAAGEMTSNLDMVSKLSESLSNQEQSALAAIYQQMKQYEGSDKQVDGQKFQDLQTHYRAVQTQWDTKISNTQQDIQSISQKAQAQQDSSKTEVKLAGDFSDLLSYNGQLMARG